MPEREAKLEALLDYLKRSRGFDFAGYKRSSLMRRVEKRMLVVDQKDFTDYIDYLEVHPEEFAHLFNTILINVTAFFRDEEAWEVLARDSVPRIVAGKRPADPIRVWVAGCASGEEAYTVAIVLCEALGADAFRERVKIYATDVDEEALAQARHASYSPKQLESLPQALRSKYFENAPGERAFRADLRRSVIFGRHDLIQDAPISRLDLLVCRNTLMYLNAETQGRILSRFHFALGDTGFLFLGRAEMLLTHADLFKPVDLKHRIFARTSHGGTRERLLLLAQTGDPETANHLGRHVRLRELSLDVSPVAQLVVDAHGTLALTNEEARTNFGLSARDIGRPLQDLEVSYRPVELRSLIEQAHAEGRYVRQAGVARRLASGAVQYFDLEVRPLQDNGRGTLGVSISFTDVTRHRRLEEELQRSQHELETANAELQSAQEELQTTNEELQSSNEELETTNEELQSSNEELETMNEELQSTNEELQTLNDELSQRTAEINKTSLIFCSVLGRLWAGVVVVDQEFKVLVWNTMAEQLWGLRSDEAVGQPLAQLDFGLPLQPLLGPIRACLSGGGSLHEVVLDATNRRGHAIRCHVACSPLLEDEGATRGALLLMSDVGFVEGKLAAGRQGGPKQHA